MEYCSLYTILFLPAAGVIINGLLGTRFPRKVVTSVALLSVGIPLALALRMAHTLLYSSPGQEIMADTLYRWLSGRTFTIDIGFMLDPLSMVMVLVVLVIGFIIHCYSVSYMRDDPGFRRFFVYLNLFIFFMLVLVMSDNLVGLFVGWEGVGLCSYLLIGFWYAKKSAADAGRKAFIVNRIGDCGFIIGVLLIILTFQTVNFQELKTIVTGSHTVSTATLSLIAFLLFVGAMGKSAQFPLHVWLPDAMEGPTPVSALIHAATMVNAGVYFMCRIFPLLEQAAYILPFIAGIGLVTAVYAALSALGQTDIKKILAYSTISQIGFMFMAVGSGMYIAGVFHLVTHGFFKGLLFLGAGAVMHALNGELDIHNMGGLRAALPRVSATFFLGLLALGGIFPLSGFFSKDAILWGAFERYGTLYWCAGVIAALFTVLYCGKLFGIAFLGQTRFRGHIHKPDSLITAPLLILAFFTVALGGLGLPMFTDDTIFARLITSSFTSHGTTAAVLSSHSHLLEIAMTAFVVVTVMGTLMIALRGFSIHREKLTEIERSPHPAVTLLSTGFRIDYIYESLWVTPFRFVSRQCDRIIDHIMIDGAVNGIAKLAVATGSFASALQTGYVRYYAVSIIVGMCILVGATHVLMS